MRLPNFNRLQRVILIAAAVVIALMQVSYFSENDFDGYGWVFTVLVITALCILAFHSPAKPAGFRVESGDAPEFKSSADLPTQVATNLSVVNRAADSIGVTASARWSDVRELSNMTTGVLRPPLLLYSLGLLIICKMRHNGAFLQSREYTSTRAAVAEAVAAAHNEIVRGTPSGQRRVAESYAADFREIERCAVAFFQALASNNVRTPAAKLNAWLEERSSIQGILSKPLEEVSKEEMRIMYAQLFGRAPTADIS